MVAGQPRQCAVLASLLLRAGKPVSLGTLVEDVWGDDAPASAIGSVRTYIYRIRQALGERDSSLIRLIEGGYALQFHRDSLDLNRFKQAMSKAREAKAGGNLRLAARRLSEALGMWDGGALTGVPGPFAEAQRDALTELRLACVEEHLACQVGAGLYAEAASELSALLVEHPLRERLCELLMTALYAAGRQSEALTLFHKTSHLLRQRLGVSPSPALRHVHEQILAGRLTLPQARDKDAPPPHRALGTSPAAQLPPSLPRLVGREREQECIERLVDEAGDTPSVAVVAVGGMAGVGKTAFATATAHHLAHRFPDGQLFADLRGVGSEPRSTSAVLADFLQSLGVPQSSVPDTRQARSLMLRGLLADRRVLVVLDDAHDAEQVRDLIPGSAGSMALVTSRVQLHGLVAAYLATPLTLQPLGESEARDLLAHRLGASRAAAEPGATDRLVALAGRLPLALSNIAAKAAFRPRMRLASLAEELDTGHGTLDAFAGDEDPALDVRASLMRSYQRLDRETASFLRSLSACDTVDFSLGQASRLSHRTERQARLALSHLVRAHLVNEIGPGRYSWNPLVAAFAAEQSSRSKTSSGPQLGAVVTPPSARQVARPACGTPTGG